MIVYNLIFNFSMNMYELEPKELVIAKEFIENGKFDKTSQS